MNGVPSVSRRHVEVGVSLDGTVWRMQMDLVQLPRRDFRWGSDCQLSNCLPQLDS